MEKKIFKIVPASSAAYVILFAAVLVVGFVGWRAIEKIAEVHELDAVFYLTVGGFGVISLILLLFAASVVYSHCGGGRFIVDEKGLSIKGFMYGRTIPKEQLDANAMMTFDMRQKGPYRPVLRTNGVGLPGYAEGWFRLKNREKGLLFVTDKSRVVYLPTKGGYSAF